MTASDLRGRLFYCREWVLQRLQHCLEGLGGARAPGILITGAPGAGKTALCTEVLWPSSEAGRNSRLGPRVLAHYFCQAHTHASLDPQHFVQSLARQLRRSPLINGYRGEAEACKGDLNDMFKRLVLLPLAELPPPTQNLLLLVDSVDETCCCCRSDGFGAESSCTIAELLANHHELLPPWLLLVCTARRQNKSITRMFTGFRRLCLDDLRKAHIVRDVQHYILCRLDGEETLRQHLTLDTAEMLNQLHIKSNGCFLYLERVLDGVSEGCILLREVRHIPGTLNGLYLWLCQRLFSGRQFCQVQTLLNAILASPAPLSPSQLHRAVWTKQMGGWSAEDFEKVLESMSSLLRPGAGGGSSSRGRLALFHHSFSEWLLDVKYCTQKYLCSVQDGHSMLAMSLSARAPALSPAEVQQLARHLLLSDLRGVDPSHLALWLLWTGVPVSDCLASDVPLELDVLQLLLLARSKVDGVSEDSGALRRTLERGGSGSVEMLLDGGGSLNKRDRAGRTLLAAAAHVGNLEAVTLMISRGANLEATDEDGQTPLGLAAHRGHLWVVELLLQHGARHDHTDSRGWTPLRAAAWGGHTEVVEALLAAGAQPDVSGRDGRTALRAAAWGGHEGPVKALLAAGAEIDQADVEGRTPLMAAAYMGHRAVAQLLLQSKADVNRCDSEGRTALAVACLCTPAGNMYPEMVSLLLEHEADPELEDKEGVTPLLVAAYEGKEEVAELLLEAGADPERAGKGQMSPLLAAALGGHAETVRVLLLWGATTDTLDVEGRSALSLAAAAAGGEEAVRVLLDRGLNENHQDLLGWTALHWAACEGRKNVCRTLIDGGAKLGMRDGEGNTPLLLAAQEGHTGCVELLINRGSPLDQRGSDHMTALCFAALGVHKSTVKLLLKKGADPDVKAGQGKPLLYLLALQGLADMVEILFDHGANPEARDSEERTALHASCWQGDWEMARLLLQKGKANCNAFDRERRTPLHCAAWRGHVNIAHLLLENGAFVDAQCAQGATPLCISAQEGHEELARVLLEEGKASPFHADHYGRTPIRVAAKGGHMAIVNLLEKHGVPPYQGLIGGRPEREAIQKEVVEGSGGSWSTLSPVSTGSQSLDNSLKSSKGSILTSSTYHSQATVPADSLTFTQQVQQHSLPRSRSRQAVALTGMLSGQVISELKLAQVSGVLGLNQISGPREDTDRSEVANAHSRNLSSPDRELKRNGILTNPKYGSPTYSRYVRTGSSMSYSRATDPGDDQSKISSSGYSSSRAGTERDPYYKKTEDFPIITGKPVLPSPKIIGTSESSPNSSSPWVPSKITVEPLVVPSNQIIETSMSSPKSSSPWVPSEITLEPVVRDSGYKKTEEFPVIARKPVLPSPQIIGTCVSSPKSSSPWIPSKITVESVVVPSPPIIETSEYSLKKTTSPWIPLKTENFSVITGKPVVPSTQIIGTSESSPKSYSPWIPSKITVEPVVVPSPELIGTSMSSPKKTTSPWNPSMKTTGPVYSTKIPNPVSPPPRCEDNPATMDPQFCKTGSQAGSPSPLNSPVISMTTMDPQLHLKQAIKLQFEGRTCGFNYRKETPL